MLNDAHDRGHLRILGGIPMKSKLSLCAAVIAALFANTALHAMPINYGDFTDASVGAPDFLSVTEDSMTDATPLFEAPLRVDDSLLFNPIQFTSSASNGATDTTTGELTMTIRADAGFFLGQIIIDQVGDGSISGLGTDATFASILSQVEIEDISPGIYGIITDDVVFTPGDLFELPPPQFFQFDGSLILDLTLLGIDEVSFKLTHTLMTGSEAGTTSLIQSKPFEITVESLPIPEPAVSTLICLGLLMMRRRSRR